MNNSQRKLKLSDFALGRPLANGAFGKVYLAKLKEIDYIVALKQIKKTKMLGRNSHLIKREIEIQGSLDHENILKIYDFFHTEKSIYLVLEYAMKGDLWTFMRKKKTRRLSEKEGASCVKQIALAFQHMHERGFVHRDLKPENIMLDHKGKIKLADFGWAASIAERERKTYCGTTDYIAPEIAKKKKYSKYVDIWGLGVLAFELCSGGAPFSGDDDESTKSKIKMIEYKMPRYFSEDLKDFIEKILVEDEKMRLGIEDILGHRWLENAVDFLDVGNT